MNGYNNMYRNEPPNMPETERKDFSTLMDCVCTELLSGAVWHEKAANELRKLGLRGFARMHDYNAKHDFKCKMKLDKVLCDRLDMFCNIDIDEVAKATTFMLNSPADLKPHLENWKTQESEFVSVLTEAVKQAANIDICVYDKLCCMLNAVQEEVMRIKFLLKRLDGGDWSGHDVLICSYMLHEHYERHPERGMDFNLG